jgi:transposase
VNAIFSVLRGGITWRLLPTDLPPRSTVLTTHQKFLHPGSLM